VTWSPAILVGWKHRGCTYGIIWYGGVAGVCKKKNPFIYQYGEPEKQLISLWSIIREDDLFCKQTALILDKQN